MNRWGRERIAVAPSRSPCLNVDCYGSSLRHHCSGGNDGTRVLVTRTPLQCDTFGRGAISRHISVALKRRRRSVWEESRIG